MPGKILQSTQPSAKGTGKVPDGDCAASLGSKGRITMASGVTPTPPTSNGRTTQARNTLVLVGALRSESCL